MGATQSAVSVFFSNILSMSSQRKAPDLAKWVDDLIYVIVHYCFIVSRKMEKKSLEVIAQIVTFTVLY